MRFLFCFYHLHIDYLLNLNSVGQIIHAFFISDECVKNVRIRIFLVRIFAFGLNTDRFRVSLCIQPECGEKWIRKTPNTGTFQWMLFLDSAPVLLNFSRIKFLMLLRCYLIYMITVVLRQLFIFNIFVSMSRPGSVYVVSMWSISYFHFHFHNV